MSYVREGVITHEDTLGNRGEIGAGDVQVISAGTGIQHSEGNEGATPVRLFQIWLKPRTQNGDPLWGTKTFPKADRSDRFVPLASGRGEAEALPIRS